MFEVKFKTGQHTLATESPFAVTIGGYEPEQPTTLFVVRDSFGPRMTWTLHPDSSVTCSNCLAIIAKNTQLNQWVTIRHNCIEKLGPFLPQRKY